MAEQMKPSGIDWIGDIPKSWKVKPIAYMTKSRSGGTPDRNNLLYWENGTIPWMSSGEVNKVNIYDTDEKITTLAVHHSSAKIISKNAVMVALNGQGKTKGMSAILRIDSACNQSLCAFSCNAGILYYEYLFWCFQTMYTYLRQMSGDDVRDGLAASYVKKQKIPVPKYEEQQAIADFLDKECAQIDSIAADLEKQIELLQQYKKSLITETVTKGLNKSVPMKDSGIDWIGKIPNHYEIIPLKYLFSLYAGGDVDEFDFSDEQNEKQKYPIYSNSLENKGLFGYTSKYRFSGKTFTVTGRGDIGKAIPRFESYYPIVRLLACIPKSNANNEYYSFCVNCADVLGDQTAMSQLTTQKLGAIKVPMPPLKEQKQIVEFLNQKCLILDQTISIKENQLNKLEQHKKSLIYEYVTGKKRVKEVQ